MIKLPLVFDRILKNRLRFDPIPLDDIKSGRVDLSKLLRSASIQELPDGQQVYYYLLDKEKISKLTPLNDKGKIKTNNRLYCYARHQKFERVYAVAISDVD